MASLARRFRTGLPGLKLLLAGDLDAMAGTETECLVELRDLQEGCRHPTPELIEQAAHCGRCALGESGQAPCQDIRSSASYTPVVAVQLCDHLLRRHCCDLGGRKYAAELPLHPGFLRIQWLRLSGVERTA